MRLWPSTSSSRPTLLESETATLVIGHSGEDRLGSGGAIILADDRPERLLLVATVIARSVILARDETLVSDVFERTAPIVSDLRENGRARLPVRQVMRYVGNVLSARHRVMGTVQASERPDLLWDHPELSWTGSICAWKPNMSWRTAPRRWTASSARSASSPTCCSISARTSARCGSRRRSSC